MNGLLIDKRVLVTGASSGIGRAIAVAFAREGAVVAVHARSRQSAQLVVDEIVGNSGRSVPVAGDLLLPNAAVQVTDSTLSQLGGIDIVVNNAGICEKGGVGELSEQTWRDTIELNLNVPFLICKHLVPEMLGSGNGGGLIFCGSIAATLADPQGSAYCASKAGVNALMRSLAAELGPKGIRVNAICPGWVDSPMAVRCHEQMPLDSSEGDFETFYDHAIRKNMLGVRIVPGDVAELAVFLASEKARHITAQSINVCAGSCPS